MELYDCYYMQSDSFKHKNQVCFAAFRQIKKTVEAIFSHSTRYSIFHLCLNRCKLVDSGWVDICNGIVHIIRKRKNMLLSATYIWRLLNFGDIGGEGKDRQNISPLIFELTYVNTQSITEVHI